MITTCSKCGKLYETTTEDADAPGRECYPCWRARQDWAEDRPLAPTPPAGGAGGEGKP